jgi:cell division protein ZapA
MNNSKLNKISSNLNNLLNKYSTSSDITNTNYNEPNNLSKVTNEKSGKELIIKIKRNVKNRLESNIVQKEDEKKKISNKYSSLTPKFMFSSENKQKIKKLNENIKYYKEVINNAKKNIEIIEKDINNLKNTDKKININKFRENKKNILSKISEKEKEKDKIKKSIFTIQKDNKLIKINNNIQKLKENLSIINENIIKNKEESKERFKKSILQSEESLAAYK